MGKIHPEAYEKFIEHIPINERDNILQACYKRLMDPDPAIHMPLANAFIEYDLICAYYHAPCLEKITQLMSNKWLVLGTARSFIFYTYHNYFIDDKQALANMHKIANLPAIIVHGRYDIICRPEIAYTLHKNWPNSELWMVEALGHGSCSNKAKALAEATDYFADRLPKSPN